MPPPVEAAPAAVASSMPETVVPAASVERLKAMPEPAKPLASLDDAFSSYFKNKLTDAPAETPEETKPKPENKKEPEAKVEKAKEPVEIVEDSKQTKILDPETITPSKEIKSKEALLNWKQANENSKKIYNENKKLSEKIKSLEAVVAQKGGLSQEEIKALKGQIEELRPYREMVDIQHDPDFRKNYDEPMEASKKAIHKILKDLQTPDETIALIDFTNHAQVDKVIAVMEEAGQKTLSRRVLAHAEEIQKLHEKRQEALGNAKTKFSEFSKTREQTNLTKKTESEAIMNQVVQQAYELKDDKGTLQLPFLALREIPPDATKQQLNEVESHNKMAEQLQGEIQNIIKNDAPEHRALTAVRAVVGAVRDAQFRGAIAKINELEEELKRVSVSGSEKKNLSSPKASTTPLNTMTAEESMQNFFSNRKR